MLYVVDWPLLILVALRYKGHSSVVM